MLERGHVERSLKKFGKEVRADARTNLLGRNVSKRLANSIDYELEVFKNSFAFSMSMEDYGEYLDKGVSGTKTKYNTPYSYKDKMPPPKAFDRWAVQRGLAGRDVSGRFLSRKSLTFALAKHKFMHGQEPTKFFTRAFEKNFRELPDDLIEAYGLDVEDLLRTSLNAK